MPTKREIRAVADGLGRILEAVERGELDAPPGMIARLDGARMALESISAPARVATAAGRPRAAPGAAAPEA